MGLVAALSNGVMGHFGAPDGLAALNALSRNASNRSRRFTNDVLRLKDIGMDAIILAISSCVSYIGWQRKCEVIDSHSTVLDIERIISIHFSKLPPK